MARLTRLTRPPAYPRRGCGRASSGALLALALAVVLPAPIAAAGLAERIVERHQLLFQRGVEAAEAGDYARARVAFDMLVLAPALRPADRARAYHLRGLTRADEGAWTAAAQDYARALQYDAGHAPARLALGLLQLEGLGLAADEAAGADMVLQAARTGLAGARHAAARLLLEGRGVEQDVDRAVTMLEAAAESGHAHSWTVLAALHAEGRIGAGPDPERARELYARAIGQGDESARSGLARLLENNATDDAQLAAAIAQYREAARAGEARAMARLGWLHLEGKGVDRDPGTARAWFEQAAAAGSTRALTFLAWMHESGTGVPRDARRALQLYEQAAAGGDHSALSALARISLQLAATLPELETALDRFKRAADVGDTAAGNSYAWLRSTLPEPQLRDGSEAVRYARAAVASDASAARLDTLAAAYAEAGEFDQAVTTQEQAIAALPADAGSMLAEFRTRLSHYRSGRAWQESRRPDAGPEPPVTDREVRTPDPRP